MEKKCTVKREPGGSLPYGYTIGLLGVCINPAQAKTIRVIFGYVERGGSQAKIAEYLNENGYLPARGKKFYSATIGQIIGHAAKYFGEAVNGRKWPAILLDDEITGK